MKKGSILLLVVFCLNLGGCLPTTTPSIEYENVSRGGEVIKNVKVKWDKVYPLGKSEMKFCGGLSQHQWIDRDSDFFGPVHIEWENAKGEKLTKDFLFTKDQLPGMKNRDKVHAFVEFYFTQDDVYLYTSDTPNLKEIRDDLFKKAGLTCQEYRDREFIKKWGRKCLEEGCDEDFKPKPTPSKNK
jgi:hypothetical protein